MKSLPIKNRICIITGHYGSGKTNLAVNLALKLKSEGKRVSVVDLDIVNPYFRTADFDLLFKEHNIKTILPIYANTNLDIPALPAQVNSIFDDEESYAVVDVGGDDTGAIALGRYARDLERCGYDLLYVVNGCRYLTKSPEEAISLLKDIEMVSRLKATGIVNNTNLGEQTTVDTVQQSIPFANEAARLADIPLLFTTSPDFVDITDENIFKTKIYVKSPW